MNGGDKARVLHIQEAVDFIIHYTDSKDKNYLTNEPLLRFAVERKLEIIGEAANHLSDDLKQEFSEVEWKTIIAFRNFIVHEYFGIDLKYCGM